MSTLFNITERLLKAYEMEMSDEYDEDIMADTIEGIELELESKADNFAWLIDHINGDLETIKKEKQRLSGLETSKKNFIRRLKVSLQGAMEATGKIKFGTAYRNFLLQNNPVSVRVSNVDELKNHIEYWKPRKWDESELNKTAIKDAIKAGVEVPGASLESSVGLRIR